MFVTTPSHEPKRYGLRLLESLPVLAKVGDDAEKLAAVSLCKLQRYIA